MRVPWCELLHEPQALADPWFHARNPCPISSSRPRPLNIMLLPGGGGRVLVRYNDLRASGNSATTQ